MLERSKSNRVLPFILAGPVALGISVGVISDNTKEGRGRSISECPDGYPGLRRDIRVINMGVLSVLAEVVKAVHIRDSYASGGYSEDIATLDGELACYQGSADNMVGSKILLLPAGLEALRYVRGDFSTDEEPFNLVPPGLIEVVD